METAVNERPIPTGEGLTFEKVWAMFQESRQEADLRGREIDKRIKELSEQMGGLHNSFGEMAEHLVAPGIAEKFNSLGFHFDSISPGGRKILDKDGKTRAEIDLILENGDYIIAIEVESKPKEKDIEHHIKRLEILREHREKHKEKKKILLGAIAGAVFPDDVRKAALEAGFYVLVQSGDTMKMEITDEFTPREW